MNIFYLHKDPIQCSIWHIDKHVVKMITEYAQLLCTTHRVLDGKEKIVQSTKNKVKRYVLNDERENILFKSCHINHPSNIWTRMDKNNYLWLFELYKCLHNEFIYRYDHNHESYTKLHEILKNPPDNIKNIKFSEPLLAMPDKYKLKDHIESYRLFYINDKKDFASWKKRERPYWFIY